MFFFLTGVVEISTDGLLIFKIVVACLHAKLALCAALCPLIFEKEKEMNKTKAGQHTAVTSIHTPLTPVSPELTVFHCLSDGFI